ALVCARLFLAPLIVKALGGAAEAACTLKSAPLAHALPANGPREHYVRARLHETAQGTTLAPASDQDSSLMSVLAGTNALARQASGAPAQRAGEAISYLSWTPD
ncbi:MAG: molybdopterin molybdenumtransferase MoeA, partial [Hyphomonadaceae bacterium]